MNDIKPRKPVVALLMSAVLPGFGQLYNGEVNRAIWLFLAFSFLNVPWLVLIALYLPGGLLVPLLLVTFFASMTVWIYGMVDAWRHARVRTDYRPERWQTSGLYTLVFVLCNIVAIPLLTIYVRANFVEPFRIPTASMAPSVLAGDFLFADKRYNCPGCKYRIEQGDVAVFAMPNDRTRLAIKRIIGLPGDRVRVADRVVSVNGQPLSTPGSTNPAVSGTVEVIERGSNGREWTVQWGPDRFTRDVDVVVPPGEVFVLGDNRSNSIDSRETGPVRMEDVVGRARQIWFSLGRDGIRWDRLGARVQ